MTHTYTSLNIHLVFSTKERQPLITGQIREELYAYMIGILKNLKCKVISIGGVEDHVHILCQLHTEKTVSEVVRMVKANSSKWVNENNKIVGRFEWQRGYGAFTVSSSKVDAVVGYIGMQAEHHKTRSFREEFLLFLKNHAVECDEQYLWK